MWTKVCGKHINTYTHKSFLLGDGTHKVCMCVSFLFLKKVKSKSLLMVSKHSFGKPPSIQLCKVIILENLKFRKIETSFTSTMVAPLIDLYSHKFAKSLPLITNSFSIHKTATFKFHHCCQRKHETCDQTLAPIDFNVFKSLIWCYFPKHCASFCVIFQNIVPHFVLFSKTLCLILCSYTRTMFQPNSA
jgi:hypothetical protein